MSSMSGSGWEEVYPRIEYHDIAGHPDYRRLLIASLLKRYYWWDDMIFDCKSYCQLCVVCKRAKLDRQGGVALHPLGVPTYPWTFVSINYVACFLKVVPLEKYLFLLCYTT